MSTYMADSAETRYVTGPLGERFAYRRFGRPGGRPLVMHMRLRGTIDHWDPAFLEPLAAEARQDGGEAQRGVYPGQVHVADPVVDVP